MIKEVNTDTMKMSRAQDDNFILIEADGTTYEVAYEAVEELLTALIALYPEY